MRNRKKIKRKSKDLGGLNKLAHFTSESISSAYDAYKKNK